MTEPIPTGPNLLQVPLHNKPKTAATIGELLVDVAREYFHQGRKFTPQETFGTEDWRGDIAHSLILEGYLNGEMDNDGNILDYDEAKFNLLIDLALNNLSDYVYGLTYPEDEEPDYAKNYMAIQLRENNGTHSVVGFRHTLMTRSEAENWLKTEAPFSQGLTWVISRQNS